MQYFETRDSYTLHKIPESWKKAVTVERMAEILIYRVIDDCLENLESVFLELDVTDSIAKVLMSWQKKEQIAFGSNALKLSSPNEDGKVTLSCDYDIDEIKEDMEMLATDMFGSVDLEEVGEKSLYDDDSEIPDYLINPFINKIKKKQI